MKEIPILFSTSMAQAILEGRKTQTRRLAAVPVGDYHGTDIMDWGLSKHPYQEDGKWLYRVQKDVDDYSTFELKPKYGQADDLLWVRETWFPAAINGNKIMVGYYDKDPANTREFTTEKVDFYWKQLNKGRMIPSIHIPKEAARIWLQITDIRVERLQDISEEDAIAEGVKPAHCESNEKCPSSLCKEKCSAIGDWWNYQVSNGEGFAAYSAKESFETLWQFINGPDSWNANPFIWAISFRVLSTTGKPDLNNL